MRRLIAVLVVGSVVLGSIPVAAQEQVPNDPFWRNLCEQNKYAPGVWDSPQCAPYLGPQPQMVSAKLAVAGILIAAAGTGVLFHPSEDTYHVLGDPYCVGNYRVDSGSCGSALETQIGLAMIGGGVLMAWLGLRSKHVSVAPSVSPTRKAVTARIQW